MSFDVGSAVGGGLTALGGITQGVLNYEAQMKNLRYQKIYRIRYSHVKIHPCSVVLQTLRLLVCLLSLRLVVLVQVLVVWFLRLFLG